MSLNTCISIKLTIYHEKGKEQRCCKILNKSQHPTTVKLAGNARQTKV